MPALSLKLLNTMSIACIIFISGFALAVHNNFMFGFFAFSCIHAMLLCEPVVTTAVPCGEPIGVALPSVGELRTCQSLNVKEFFWISIGAETHLRLGAQICH
jgi:hypothetical protein